MACKNAVTAVAVDRNAVGESPANPRKTNALRRLRRFYSVTLPSAALVKTVTETSRRNRRKRRTTIGSRRRSGPPRRTGFLQIAPQALDRFKDVKHKGITGTTRCLPRAIPRQVGPYPPPSRFRPLTRYYKGASSVHSRRQTALREAASKTGALCAKSALFAGEMQRSRLENRWKTAARN